jgi:hypothetical protein
MLKHKSFRSLLVQATTGLVLVLGAVQGVSLVSANEAPRPTVSPSASPTPCPVEGESLPPPRGFGDDSDDDKKGTIGLVCKDGLGRRYEGDARGTSEERVLFRRCLEEVVSSWTKRDIVRATLDARSSVELDKGTIGNVRGMRDLESVLNRALPTFPTK